MKNVWTWLKNWWENNKGVIEGFVLPKLDTAVIPFAKFLESKGVPRASAMAVAEDSVVWLKEYLKRQL